MRGGGLDSGSQGAGSDPDGAADQSQRDGFGQELDKDVTSGDPRAWRSLISDGLGPVQQGRSVSHVIYRCARGACTLASSKADACLPQVPPRSGESGVPESSPAWRLRPSR